MNPANAFQLNPFESIDFDPHLYSLYALNRLLRREYAAVEAYGRVLDQHEVEDGFGWINESLQSILQSHQFLAHLWKAEIHGVIGKNDESSGTWGVLVGAMVGTLSLFGTSPCLLALLESEEYGLKGYQDFSTDDFIDKRYRRLVTLKAIPEMKSHIDALNRIRKKLKHSSDGG